MQNSALNVHRLANPDSVTAGIQEAIDALPDQGGTVFLPAGKYLHLVIGTLEIHLQSASERSFHDDFHAVPDDRFTYP